jgi:hypothetical protein
VTGICKKKHLHSLIIRTGMEEQDSYLMLLLGKGVLEHKTKETLEREN